MSEDEFQREAGAAFRRTFRTTDPFRAPFSDNIEHRLLLYPLGWGYAFDADEREALAHAAAAVGDDGFYVTYTERFRDPPEPLDYFVPLEDIGGYGPLDEDRSALEHADPFLCNALVSPRGLWGAIISDEGHAVVGGSADFVRVLVDHYPRAATDPSTGATETLTPPREQVYDMLLYYRFYGTLDSYEWLPVLLEHVFGSAEAAGVLEEFERRERERSWIVSYEVAFPSDQPARELAAALESDGYVVELRRGLLVATRADSVANALLEEQRIEVLARTSRGRLQARGVSQR
ncbi:MAG: hypothetical protein ACRDNE_03345 [Gaiellaceae bacterium]